jgi:hypothetical protein
MLESFLALIVVLLVSVKKGQLEVEASSSGGKTTNMAVLEHSAHGRLILRTEPALQLKQTRSDLGYGL